MQQSNTSINAIKESIIRLMLTIGVWCDFLYIYAIKFNESLSFQPVILGLLGIYSLIELIIIIRAILDKNNQYNHKYGKNQNY